MVAQKIQGIKSFRSMPNFRQVNEHHAQESQITPKLFRSSRPDFLNKTEVGQFMEMGIRSIIDFRSVREYRKTNGHKLLDNNYAVYKVKLPLNNSYKAGQDVTIVPVNRTKITHGIVSNGPEHAEDFKEPKAKSKTKMRQMAQKLQNVPLSSSTVTDTGISGDDTLGDNSDTATDIDHFVDCDTGRSTHGNMHILIDFFRINYVWAVFKRAPWYIQLFSILYLVVDIILSTNYKHFVRFYARNVLNKEGLIGQYIDMINYSQGSIYAALTLLSKPENVPAMLNCAHGKDRTGIVSALVLACLGASDEQIALDYSRSETELADIYPRIHAEIVEKFHMCTSFTGAKAETMASVLTYIHKEYGSVSNYLESIGFDAACQEKLRKNLLE